MLFRRGTKGENVRIIQKAMKVAFDQIGVDDCFNRLVVDGDFGAATEGCVVEAQKNLNLKQDGVIGSATLAALGIVLEAPKPAGKITYEILMDAAGHCPSDMFASILPHINEGAQRFKVNTKPRLAHFLSQIGHESGFKVRAESMSYSTGRMQKIFGRNGKRSKLYDSPESYSRNPVALGSYVYADRMGNGNEASGDGYKYRGRGLIQTTGKSNYTALTKDHNDFYPEDKKDFVADPDLLLTPKYAVRSAFIWWYQNKMNKAIDSGASVRRVTKLVNGGSHGLTDRNRRYSRLIKALA